MVGKGGESSGTCIKDTWTKPKGGRVKGGGWGCVGRVQGKWRQLYVNNNKKRKIKGNDEKKKIVQVTLPPVVYESTYFSGVLFFKWYILAILSCSFLLRQVQHYFFHLRASSLSMNYVTINWKL